LFYLNAFHLLDFAMKRHEYNTRPHTGKGFKYEFNLHDASRAGVRFHARFVVVVLLAEHSVNCFIFVILHLFAAGQKHHAFALEVRFDEAPQNVQLLRQLQKRSQSQQLNWNGAGTEPKSHIHDHIVLAQARGRAGGSGIVHPAIPAQNRVI
jgi:hypothetical protein